MKRHLVLLLGLVLVLAFVIYYHTFPGLSPFERFRGVASVPAEQPLPGEGAQLADGSFNPNPPIKRRPNADPADLVGKSEWRERYRPYLEQMSGPPDSATFYVYPFLDNTPSGVGLHCTYGWHLFATAVLAHQTNARLVNFSPPEHYGLPQVNTSSPDAMITPDQWKKRALEDSATQKSNYVITGVYEITPDTDQYHLTIFLLDRNKPGPGGETILVDDVREREDEFYRFAIRQRASSQSLVQKLVDMGLVRRRPFVEVKGIDLNTELREVAALLDGNDGWAVMDGIDRALQLSILFPQSSLPLQAASYGMIVLGWSLFEYGYQSHYAIDYALRAYALAQLTLLTDMNPSLAQMNWMYSCLALGHDSARRRLRLTGDDRTEKQPEFFGYRLGLVTSDYTVASLPANLVATLPDWQVLRFEARRTWFIGNNAQRGYFEERHPHWRKSDLYLQAALLHNLDSKHAPSEEDSWERSRKASEIAMQSTLADELATLLVALKGTPAFERLLKETEPLFFLRSGKVRRCAAKGDYYGIREIALSRLSWLDAPYYPQHPAYNIMAVVAKAAQAVRELPALAFAPSGFTGFEFTPAERVLLAQRRDHIGPMQAVRFWAWMKGVHETFVELARTYLTIRPESSAGWTAFFEYLDRDLEHEGARDLHKRAALTAYDLFPLDAKRGYELGRIYFGENRKLGNAYLKAYAKVDPSTPEPLLNLARLYREHGYHRMAVDYYDRYLKEKPAYYYGDIERALSLCQMGRWNDPELRKVFDEPVAKLPGNGYFHKAKIEYLRDWLQDYDAARIAASYCRSLMPPTDYWLRYTEAAIEKAAGNNDKALEFLAQVSTEGKTGLELASIHAQLAQEYMALGRLDLAETHVQQAAGVDSWKCDVIFAMADLACAKGDYDTAIKEYERSIERYGPGWEMKQGLARCYREKGDADRAIAILEKEIFGGDSAPAPVLMRDLMRLYAETNRPEKARELMERLLAPSGRTRALISETLQYYKKFDPDHAKEIWDRIDEIMAGPML